MPKPQRHSGYSPRWPGRQRAPAPEGLHYDPRFLSAEGHLAICQWLTTLHPIWENRFSDLRPPPEEQEQRRLLRPVYWLGNWQFACLDYYRPPNGIHDRCVQAEPFPALIQKLVDEIEVLTRTMFHGKDLPDKWKLNTCLINLYGKRLENEKWVDTARVGEHRDFEPGPVASVSLGERALFQFVESRRPGEREGVVSQQWLDDGSLQIFGGDRWKKRLFHRVQRVDHRAGRSFALNVTDFVTRRVNFTFRYVPDEHVVPVYHLSEQARRDVDVYVRQLAEHSAFFARELAR